MVFPMFSHGFPMFSQVFSQVPVCLSDLQRQDGIFHVELKYTTSHGAQLIEARYIIYIYRYTYNIWLVLG